MAARGREGLARVGALRFMQAGPPSCVAGLLGPLALADQRLSDRGPVLEQIHILILLFWRRGHIHISIPLWGLTRLATYVHSKDTGPIHYRRHHLWEIRRKQIDQRLPPKFSKSTVNSKVAH